MSIICKSRAEQVWGVWPTTTIFPETCGPGMKSRSESHIKTRSSWRGKETAGT
jgi:hypothetical protein